MTRDSLGVFKSAGVVGNLNGGQLVDSQDFVIAAGTELIVVVALAQVAVNGQFESSFKLSFTGGGVTLKHAAGVPHEGFEVGEGVACWVGKVDTGASGHIQFDVANMTCAILAAMVQVSGLVNFQVDTSLLTGGTASEPALGPIETINPNTYIQCAVYQYDSVADFSDGFWDTPTEAGQEVGIDLDREFSLSEGYEFLTQIEEATTSMVNTGTGVDQGWGGVIIALS